MLMYVCHQYPKHTVFITFISKYSKSCLKFLVSAILSSAILQFSAVPYLSARVFLHNRIYERKMYDILS